MVEVGRDKEAIYVMVSGIKYEGGEECLYNAKVVKTFQHEGRVVPSYHQKFETLNNVNCQMYNHPREKLKLFVNKSFYFS